MNLRTVPPYVGSREPLAALFPDSGAIRKAERDGKPVISMDSEIQESAVCLMNQIVEQING